MSRVENQETRDGFSSGFGFIVACIGSAVGMANIWLFPYRLGQFGGAAFLIPYILFLLIGVWGVMGEMAFGRARGTGPLGAFKQAFARKQWAGGSFFGFIPVLGSLGIAVGYAVVVGWILRFLAGSVTGSMLAAENSGAYFGAIAGPFGSIIWHLLALGLTFLVMISGISRGIERVNKVVMPLFFLLFLILAVRVVTLPGALEGYSYLFVPKWDALADPKTWVYALGQAFFSLSLAGSGTLVYGSYLSKKEDVVSSARNVAVFDTLAALLAAVVVIPAVFAFGLDISAGPALMFITMPNVFKMMPLGDIFAIIFFIAVFFAGISSLMNLMEAPVEALQQRFSLSRKGAIGTVAVVSIAAGLILQDGDKLGLWMDIVSIYLIPLGALLAAVIFFWVCGKSFAREQVKLGHKGRLTVLFEPLTRYVFCGVTFAVYILGILYGGIG